MVCVKCMTFNHHAFIEDAMNGFVIQQTDFPFVCVIVDDASTDGESEVIKKYLHSNFDLTENLETDDYVMNFGQHKNNRNCYFAVLFLKFNHYSIKKSKLSYYSKWQDNSKYIAYCEGDDFWIHSHFLRYSVDFLEINVNYSAVYGNRISCNCDATKFRKNIFLKELDIQDIMSGCNMGLRNLCMRRDIYKIKTSSSLDLDIYLKCMKSGYLKYINDDFAVYRLTGEGVATSRSNEQRYYYCFKDYYRLHKDTQFIYQKYLVKYQIGLVIRGLLKRNIGIKQSVQLLRLYHVPSTKRFIWYIYFIISFCLGIGIFFHKKTKEVPFIKHN